MDFEAVLDILFPPECLACRKGLIKGTLCAACARNIGGPPAIAIKSMRLGGERGDGEGRVGEPDTSNCYFLGAAGRYENHVLKTLIHALKFGGIRVAAKPLAEILAHHARRIALPLKNFTVVPMPLSKARLRERGFNQSALIAKPFAQLLGLPFSDRILARTRHRKPQSTTASLAERRENIRGCFALCGDLTTCADCGDAALCARQKNIILVDDVSTSGSTFVEAARVLSEGGAGIILALAVAKA